MYIIWYFKLRQFDLTEFIIWSKKCLEHQVAKTLMISFWQELRFFYLFIKTANFFTLINYRLR